MTYGMTSEQFNLLSDLVIRPLQALGAKVFIFGSRVTGKHHSHSDVDLLVRPSKDHQISNTVITNLKEAIEESRFPFSVDLVCEEDLAQSYRSNVFRTMIEIS